MYSRNGQEIIEWPDGSFRASGPSGHQQPAPMQTVVPFTGLAGPGAVAVDSKGAIYVADTGNNRVVKLTVR
jgi:DNA-binding beta-propeller fold protein YncE